VETSIPKKTTLVAPSSAGPAASQTRLSSPWMWAKHLRMAVLGYSAYFGAFYASFEQYVGGGADVVAVPWP
jgi:hypothetical protein